MLSSATNHTVVFTIASTWSPYLRYADAFNESPWTSCPPVVFGWFEAEALGGSQLGVLRMTVDVRAGDDLYLFGRGTDGILLLLEMSHILLNAGASCEREDRHDQKNRPHRDMRAPCYELFFLRSAQRFFIAIDSRFLPAGVRPPRLRFFGLVFVVEPLGRPRRFFPRPGMTDPTSASMARPSRSFSFVKSASNLSRSKIRSFGALAV